MMQPADATPHYFLYGEALFDVERSFLHVEAVERRCSVNDWTIRRHTHPDHHQILVLTEGSGVIIMEERATAFRAHSLIVVPAMTVHAYRFQPGSNGWVVTIAAPFLQAALECHEELGTAFTGTGCCIQGGVADAPGLIEAFDALEREFIWSAPGRRLAIKASLQRILVTIARLQGDGPAVAPGRRRTGDIVVRYRRLVERDFRQQPDLPVFAKALGITTASLNTACRAMTGKSALTLVHDRILIEAKRNLLYTGMSVGDVALSLGFADPAYFNRFFSRRAGMTPGAFRAAGNGDVNPVA